MNKIIKTYGSDETADIPTEALKAAIISIGQYELNKNGINDTTIFFGDGYDYKNEKERLGFYSLKSKSIIIDDKKFIEYYRKKRNVDFLIQKDSENIIPIEVGRGNKCKLQIKVMV